METNTKNLLLGELHGANAYIERVYHGIYDIALVGKQNRVQETNRALYAEILQLFSRELLNPQLLASHLQNNTCHGVRDKCQRATAIIEGLLHLNLDQKIFTKIVVDYINLLYHYGHQLHLYCHSNTNLEIQLPRANLVQTTHTPSDPENEIPQFTLPPDAFELSSARSSSISSLKSQRDKKYEKLVREGHEFIFTKEVQKGLHAFQKAQSYNETAEILTLLGWSFSLLGKMEQAKRSCLKAIQKDPDYGPPYNDLGSYLLSEGLLDEGLKWFTMAKKALKYQNREYPYINSGRVYIAKKNIKKALEEFEKAQTFAPYNEELLQTITKIKKKLGAHFATKKHKEAVIHLFKSSKSNPDKNNPPPPVF